MAGWVTRLSPRGNASGNKPRQRFLAPAGATQRPRRPVSQIDVAVVLEEAFPPPVWRCARNGWNGASEAGLARAVEAQAERERAREAVANMRGQMLSAPGKFLNFMGGLQKAGPP